MTSSCEKNYKHFINYKDDDHRIKPLRIMLLRTSAYVKCCNGETKWVSFFIEDDELLGTYINIWNKSSSSIKKELDCKPIYNKKKSENQNKVLR